VLVSRPFHRIVLQFMPNHVHDGPPSRQGLSGSPSSVNACRASCDMRGGVPWELLSRPAVQQLREYGGPLPRTSAEVAHPCIRVLHATTPIQALFLAMGAFNSPAPCPWASPPFAASLA